MAFGRGPLSHPLLAEAIEDLFVPLAVNNRTGKDGGQLARYEEPAFNNPVVRYFSASGEELIPRRSGVWGTAETAERMLRALEAGRYDVPPYLRLAVAELSATLPERVVFAVHCFWQGQARLGRLDGVLRARPGWLAGDEVVEVLYDPRTIGLGELVRVARREGALRRVFVGDERELRVARDVVGEDVSVLRERPRDARPSDDLLHLRRSALRFLPITRLQALRVNGTLEAGLDPGVWLSPRQRALLPRIEAVLARDPGALVGLERPGDPGALAAYRAELLGRLE